MFEFLYGSLAYESAEQKPKHCLTWDFLSAMVICEWSLPDHTGGAWAPGGLPRRGAARGNCPPPRSRTRRTCATLSILLSILSILSIFFSCETLSISVTNPCEPLGVCVVKRARSADARCAGRFKIRQQMVWKETCWVCQIRQIWGENL